MALAMGFDGTSSDRWSHKALNLPVDAATQTFAFLGRKSSGKTYAAGKLVELLLEASVQVVILDTVGNWYGLRLGSDGKSRGFDIPVIGGLRGDIPVEESAGELIANVVADTGTSAVLDISQFSLAARQRFATSFGERLWLRKKGDHHPRPLHLVIEESQLIIPQLVRPGQQRMVGIYEEIVRLGRNYGIGVSMISQRPQSVNKEVLNQTECLFVFQTSGSQERDALAKWVVAQGGPTQLTLELPALPTGVGYVWSPQWLQKFERVKIAPKRTYDSSATPKVGDRRVVSGELTKLNLDSLLQQMQEVVERAKAEDPRELRKQISILKRELAMKTAVPKPEPLPQVVERMPAADARVLETLSEQLVEVAATLRALANGIRRVDMMVIDDPAQPTTRAQRAKLTKWYSQNLAPRLKPVEASTSSQEPRMRGRVKPSPGDGSAAGPSDGAQRRMLTALAQRAGGLSARQLGVRSGMSSRSGTFARYLSHFRSQGWIVGGATNMTITGKGLTALGPFDRLPEGKELLDHWLSELGSGGVSRILGVVASAYPEQLPLDEIGRRADMSSTSGTFARYVSKLRSLELVEGRGALRASDELFGGADAR